ncbi:hypothetical protein [Streptomyces sp. NPDC092903]|uniref:hypothetical protein n=1 Tax=Streptomyces sp. NPDC092903 TaxID=3366017 RepID=UPI00381165F8
MDVEAAKTATESITFALPKELRCNQRTQPEDGPMPNSTTPQAACFSRPIRQAPSQQVIKEGIQHAFRITGGNDSRP